MWVARMLWVRGGAAFRPLPKHPTPCSLPVLCCRGSVSGKEKLLCTIAGNQQEVHSNSVENVEARTCKLLSDLESSGIIRHSHKKVSSLYHLLLDLGITTETIEAQLLATPDLLDHPIQAWTGVCEVLLENHLPSLKILQNIALCPELLKVKPSLLRHNLAQFQMINVGKQNLLSLVTKYPTLYFFSPSRIKKRLENLNGIFPPSDLKALIRKSPNVLTDGWNDIMDKMLYINKEMGLEQPHITASKVLRKPLLHIKTRHLFLLRAGLYKKPNLLRDKQSYRRNPPLAEIMDTSDAHFANRIARLTDQEYTVFKSMMEATEREAEYGESEEDSEDEESSNQGYRKNR